MKGAGSGRGWLRGPSVSLLVSGLGADMAGCRAVVVLGLVAAYWWAELGPGVSSCRTWGSQGWCALAGGWGRGPGCPGAVACSLVVEAGSWG